MCIVLYSIVLIFSSLCTYSAYRYTIRTRHTGVSKAHPRQIKLRAEPSNGYTDVPQAKLYDDVTFGIMGGGAFSLALAKVLSYKNIRSLLLVRDSEVAKQINENRYHPKYLTDCKIPETTWATADPKEALMDVDYIVHAVPMQQSRNFLLSVRDHLPPDAPILSVTKGVEQGTFALMNDIIVETLGEDKRAAYLSGPSFAREIMDGTATAVVIASKDDTLASELADILSSVEFRCHTSRDVKGVELGGAIKNVLALAAGMCEGLGLGMNAMSSLVTWMYRNGPNG